MRLGIMGGTFDPIHKGHLLIARSAMREARLDRVLFLPDGDPPHKLPGTPDAHRLAMVRLAIAGQQGFEASDMELRRQGTTYTVDTLEHLSALAPGTELLYIVGSDTLRLFPTWKTAWKVAALCRMIVAPRPGDSPEETRWLQRKLFADYGLETLLLSEPGPDISSTRIRELLRAGQPADALIPEAVAGYIRANKLYRE
ncbi:MAG TPA: nicotinate-nucleotide adenylyltransferase [Clostridia bacterium]|jgi:nicotinate-nucleotide adenylyltransferase|nr:nicotinate-nucleotide adenylyltransferase [Clostridia bacterium]HPA60836.1 nicotinate-nucleotide adenylyltransferase [Clostridia bacterium]HPY43519.1 nicotinate-nucleotide adenylyltransferase [Clostridia bacterium]HQA96928.1 nicotinate-nucleotide adenylyltransferase [Clostridia bacterium]HQO54809.1 nicotinate-nucleotide adenylyltransferase [Clostridia bacterium]